MTRHLLTSTRFDFEAFRERKSSGKGPEHVSERLAQRLEAVIHQPGDAAPTALDRVLSKGFASPEIWAVARSVAGQVAPGDLVYATGHDVGLAFAAWARLRRAKALTAVYYVAPDRPRERWLTDLLSRAGTPILAVSGTAEKVDFLRRRFGDRLHGVVLADEQTDVEFFSPCTDRAHDGAPLVVSAGLEQRDYVTLASAVHGLDLDIKVCAVSPNFSDRTAVAIPDEIPGRMEMRRFEFDELRDLYRHADVTVIPLLDNIYSAGLTVLMEAAASSSPVVMTRTPGLAERFIDDDLVLGVAPGDPGAMRTAIRQVLDHPEAAAARAERARARILERHTSERYVEHLAEALESFEREHDR